ncbi:XRE family transcriptional regulator [Streptomyces hainanensis]|uniref:ImmA/IrrE family metallo-endopeptidase n=1 Tax=Streptomyces hainanensis TaxID=402648 RepID=A0A4R4TBP4_9ACTN|nr:XRE family transcriptional regulator [Streptomyces hainanensis]TDC74791.1 ImmA/IrrE family metallo-endopeptidase [Streptomyces hainanensis]
MGSIPALVEPSVLKWARESIGLSSVAAARKLGLPDDRVHHWELGQSVPTISQLKKASTVYKRPLAVFFLAEPPKDFDTLRDFRRVEGSTEAEWTPELHAEYRRALSQRECLLELLELDEAKCPSDWQLNFLPERDEDLATVARQNILDRSPLSLPSSSASPYEHLNTWTSGMEESGVLVLTSTGGKIEKREMRAFSLYFKEAPVIMLNGADSPRGRIFSLMHEYAHLILHTGGLCDTITDLKSTSPNRRLEARCNAIAAAILMPAARVLSRPEVTRRINDQSSWDYEALSSAAAPFGVSAEALLRRLLTLGRVDRDFYTERRTEFLAVYEEEELRARSGGGNWYRNTARDLGKGYVRQVADAHRRRVIDSYTAASYLNVKTSQIDRLARTAAVGNGVL